MRIEEHVFDLLPAYALGALDDEELLQVARHLPLCPACRAELASFWPAVDHLPLSIPLQTPRADLRAKILQRAGASAGHAHRPAPPVPRPLPEKRRETFSDWLRSLVRHPSALAAGALALLLVALLAASNLFLWQQVKNLQARVPGDRVQIIDMSGTENAPSAQGYLMVFSGENYGTLVVEDAPVLPEGKQYQLWLIKDGKRTSGGVFSVNEVGYGTLQITAVDTLDTYPAFGVTVEPAGGSPGPTGKKVLGGDL
jgi:anti-sigma-K factor RskA